MKDDIKVCFIERVFEDSLNITHQQMY